VVNTGGCFEPTLGCWKLLLFVDPFFTSPFSRGGSDGVRDDSLRAVGGFDAESSSCWKEVFADFEFDFRFWMVAAAEAGNELIPLACRP